MQILPVSFFLRYSESLANKAVCRFNQQQDPKCSVAGWTTAGTDNPRRHFRDQHLDLWVESCDKMGITITAKSAIAQVEAWRRRQQGEAEAMPTETRHSQFSRELFVDYLVEWIVSDDQVCEMS